MRKMASLRRIDSIRPIEGADAIECAVVGGWTVVVKRGEFHAGELAIYCEIDSFIPHEVAPFLSKGKEPREFDGIRGERLRTVRLRGQLSQGLLLKVDTVDNSALCFGEVQFPCIEGYDVSEHLKIQKYEPPVPAQLAGQVKGMFPSFMLKTDQERIQNLVEELKVWNEKNFTWEVTEKLDGSSMTVYVNGQDEGVCSRNLDLKRDENVTFWKVAIQDQLIEKIRRTSRNLALQGELIGEGIQGNKYKILGHGFFMFDAYDIDKQEYLTPSARQELAKTLEIQHVPVINNDALMNGMSVEDLLFAAEGKSALNDQAAREGIVFKATRFSSSFKAISNRWLLKND